MLPELSIHGFADRVGVKISEDRGTDRDSIRGQKKDSKYSDFSFLPSSNLLTVFPLGGPEGCQLPRESVKKPGVEVSLAMKSRAGLVTNLKTSRWLSPSDLIKSPYIRISSVDFITNTYINKFFGLH